MNCVWYVETASWKFPQAQPNVNSGKSPSESDVFARYHIGSTKKIDQPCEPRREQQVGDRAFPTVQQPRQPPIRCWNFFL